MKVRPYRLQARAEAVAATRAAILDAVDEIFVPSPGRAFSLEEVARRAGTTVQTILRHFGTKAGLLEAASARGLARVREGRDEIPSGDIAAAAEYLGRHYEQDGPVVLRFLAVEGQAPEVAAIIQRGRQTHWAWAERVFAPFLDGMDPRQRRRRRAMLVAITDLLTWKVLRLEQGLTRREYVDTVRELLEAVS
jgi:AcrR family transcriptional regulator